MYTFVVFGYHKFALIRRIEYLERYESVELTPNRTALRPLFRIDTGIYRVFDHTSHRLERQGATANRMANL
jgi:hypothetical protein